MIKAVLIFNNFGKPRLTKFYQYTPVERHQQIIRAAYLALSRRSESHCSFVEDSSIFGVGTKLVYRHFATLYFVFIVDETESELATLDLIQVFVEALDKCFQNVCEVDVIFNFPKVHAMLDEVVMGGQVLETNIEDVLKSIVEIQRLENKPDVSIVDSRVRGAIPSFPAR